MTEHIEGTIQKKSWSERVKTSIFAIFLKFVNNMSVIQNIRSKYIGVVVGAIVIALIGFLIMDAMQSNTRGLFGSDNTLMSEVNGTRIDYKKYEERRAMYEENVMAQSKEGKVSEEQKKQLRESAYNDMVNDILFNGEIEKLGLDFSDAELKDMLMGKFVDPSIKQSFVDQTTGQFDPNLVSQRISSLGKDKTGQERMQWERFQNEMITNKLRKKYTDMISKGIYLPKFMYDRDTKLNSTVAAVNYVVASYAGINDSSIKVTDEELKTYLEKMKAQFKEREDKGKVEYVAFDMIPSSEDSAKSLGVLNSLREEFMTTGDLEAFVANNSDEALSKAYVTQDKIEMPNPVEVLALPVGGVVGPQYINGVFKMVKVLDKKQMPDSAKASHILIKINETRSEEVAKATIDSLEKVVKAGTPLEVLAMTLSEDDGSKVKGGDLGWFPQGAMVPEFNDACFNGGKGDLKVVKTQFGYHLLKVVDQKDFKPAVKMAVVSKLLQVGNTTSNLVFNKANEFVRDAKDAKTFTEAAKKFGKDKRTADFTLIQSDVNGLGEARQLTRWASEAKIGDVSTVFNLTDKCVVALLTGRTTKGSLPSVNDVRPQLEYMVRKDKKAEMMSSKFKGKTSLEAISSMDSSYQIKTLDTVKINGGNELAYENRVLGACLNASNANKFVGPIPGEQGVYFIMVKSVGTDPNGILPIEMQRQNLDQQLGGQVGGMVPYILKNKAKIDDKRGNFF